MLCGEICYHSYHFILLSIFSSFTIRNIKSNNCKGTHWFLFLDVWFLAHWFPASTCLTQPFFWAPEWGPPVHYLAREGATCKHVSRPKTLSLHSEVTRPLEFFQLFGFCSRCQHQQFLASPRSCLCLTARRELFPIKLVDEWSRNVIYRSPDHLLPWTL